MSDTIDTENFPGDPAAVETTTTPTTRKRRKPREARLPPAETDEPVVLPKSVVCACGCGKSFPQSGNQKYLDDKHRDDARANRRRAKRDGAPAVRKDPSVDDGVTRLVPISVKGQKVAEKPKMYLCAVLNTAPFHSKNIGGVGFNRKSHTVVRDEQGRGKIHNRYPGQRNKLTQEQARYAQERVANTIVRWFNKDQGRGAVLSIDSDGYVQMPDDEPVANYLVMVEIEDHILGHGGELRVPTMAAQWGDDEDEALAAPTPEE